ncbi:cob(I)yrinic acid a,c-diamide adenosyltransferase [Nitrospina sp. 32_T5]|uniref:cob(I)yrinic acid a,c-diamide adenosyltransferase n=1 Tax=unclassified Nitrospina TaxID=2638683 RepID=UPI003F9C4E03
MVRISKVYTKQGDKGETSLVGGVRVPKDHPRVQAYGTVDELNSLVGLVRSTLDQIPAEAERERVDQTLAAIQQWLFDLGSELATDPKTSRKMDIGVKAEQVAWMESWMDTMNRDLDPLKSFTLPGGRLPLAFLHQCRTVCRRAEREIITLSRQEEIGPEVGPFINRLSDAFYVLGRWLAKVSGDDEILWKPGGGTPPEWK